MKCILCKKSEVYNVLFHDRAGKLHMKTHPSYPNDYINLTQLKEKDCVFVHIFHMVIYNSKNAYHPRFNLILYVHNRTYYKIPHQAHPICLHPCTNLHMEIIPHTIIQKIPPKFHHTPLQYYIFLQ